MRLAGLQIQQARLLPVSRLHQLPFGTVRELDGLKFLKRHLTIDPYTPVGGLSRRQVLPCFHRELIIARFGYGEFPFQPLPDRFPLVAANGIQQDFGGAARLGVPGRVVVYRVQRSVRFIARLFSLYAPRWNG